MNRTLSDATAPGQGKPGNNGIEEVLHNSRSSKSKLSDGEDPMSCQEHSYGGEGEYPFAAMQLLYFTTSADWTVAFIEIKDMSNKKRRLQIF